MYDDYAVGGGYYPEGDWVEDPYYPRAAAPHQARSLVGRKYEGMEVGGGRPGPRYDEYAEYDYPAAVAPPVVMDDMYYEEPIMVADQGRIPYSQRYGLPQAQIRARPRQVVRQPAPVILEEPPVEVMPQGVDIADDPLATPGFVTISETCHFRRLPPGAGGRLVQPPVSVSDEEWRSLVPAHQPPPRQPTGHPPAPRMEGPRMERSSTMVVGGSGRPDRGAQFVDGDRYSHNRNTIHIHSGDGGHAYGSPTAQRPSQGSLPISPTGSVGGEHRRSGLRVPGGSGRGATRSNSAGPRY